MRKMGQQHSPILFQYKCSECDSVLTIDFSIESDFEYIDLETIECPCCGHTTEKRRILRSEDYFGGKPMGS
jgi:DNA-directed RNA polymerase subunit RPC12/RpoP